MTSSELKLIRIDDKEDGNPGNVQGKVLKMNQDSPINPKVIENYGSWMLA